MVFESVYAETLSRGFHSWDIAAGLFLKSVTSDGHATAEEHGAATAGGSMLHEQWRKLPSSFFNIMPMTGRFPWHDKFWVPQC